MLYRLLRPLLFSLDPETAHRLTLNGADLFGVLVRAHITRQPMRVMGLEFPNPVGLAAGLDKNAEHIDALAALGFGFIEVGTVTPRPQPGNPKPRIFRLPGANALINRFGFNNVGVEAFLANVARTRWRGVLGINIGKNFDTPIETAADDYVLCLERVYAAASYVTINISSPNTKGLRGLQEKSVLDALLGQIAATRERLTDKHSKRVPLALKIAPDLDGAQIADIAAAVRAHRIDAVIATNTSVSREGVEGLPHAAEQGGLSGAPIRVRATQVLATLAGELAGEVPLIGAGGILSGADAVEKIAHGAALVQLYTGLVYRGPALVAECAQALRKAAAAA
ncbi:MAG: quinone-dependent dihydroorotate dehydrogenase [Betaproteobacteria bacterium]|nr:quinone-dependent dihydroorotate dehydrogenase [Betaproteobacteria bacterium]